MRSTRTSNGLASRRVAPDEGRGVERVMLPKGAATQETPDDRSLPRGRSRRA